MEDKRCPKCLKLYSCRRNGWGKWIITAENGTEIPEEKVTIDKTGINLLCDCGNIVKWDFTD
ncbi:MAG: hypothetical protein QXP66_01010 [Candidatus Aenigmatarchaeota archaeon]